MAGRTRISLLVCLFAFGLAGCGSDDGTIPSEQAGDMLALLDTLQGHVQDGDCAQVPGTAEELASRVEKLPSDVDSDVRNVLTKATAHLDELASAPSACTPPVETGATEPSGVETTPDTTTTEETTPTTTDETTTTTTDEEAPTEPDNNGQGNGQQPDEAPAPPTDEGPGGDTGDDGGGASPPSGGVGAGGSAG